MLRYAEEARREYENLAAPLGDDGDAIAVLDAYFALRDGDKTRALEAARRVDVEKNYDVEDLYLTLIAPKPKSPATVRH